MEHVLPSSKDKEIQGELAPGEIHIPGGFLVTQSSRKMWINNDLTAEAPVLSTGIKEKHFLGTGIHDTEFVFFSKDLGGNGVVMIGRDTTPYAFSVSIHAPGSVQELDTRSFSSIEEEVKESQ